MINAIGSTSLVGAVGGASASGGLEGLLAKYQVALADWTYCPSCTTPEGKAKIAELTDKVKAIQQQLAASGSAATIGRPQSSPPASAATQVTPASSASPKAASSLSNGLVGSQIDVFV